MENIHGMWKHRWVNPKAKSVTSEIHGLGVVAIKPIFKGETAGVLGGVIIPNTEIKEYWKEMGHVGIQIDDNFFIAPTSRKELEETGVFNHSCNPNVGFDGSIKLIAINDIKKGEELVFDYAFSESAMESFKCKCNSLNCRRIISKNDWKLIDIQNKYGKYFSAYLRKKFS